MKLNELEQMEQELVLAIEKRKLVQASTKDLEKQLKLVLLAKIGVQANALGN